MKAVIFDLWNTLAQIQDKPNPIRQFLNEVGIRPEDFQDNIFRELMTDKREVEESVKGFMKDLKLKDDPKMFSELVSLLKGVDSRKASMFPEALDVLKKLKENGIRTAILSNAVFVPEQHDERYIPDEWNLMEYIDVPVFSFDIGVVKPDPVAFLTVLERLGVDPSEVIFVDDTPANVIAAKEIGMKALLIDRKDIHDYPDKISSLSEVLKFL
jgi:epoxide hydrolase-like predicted phosphatase